MSPKWLRILVVRLHTHLAASTDCIVVPHTILDGLLTSLHIKLDHPDASQLKTVVQCYVFTCFTCWIWKLRVNVSFRQLASVCNTEEEPMFVVDQSTGDSPEVSEAFAADVCRRDRRRILVFLECVTLFTMACLIDDAKRDSQGCPDPLVSGSVPSRWPLCCDLDRPCPGARCSHGRRGPRCTQPGWRYTTIGTVRC